LENTLENENEMASVRAAEKTTQGAKKSDDPAIKPMDKFVESSLEKRIYEIEVAGMKIKLKSSHNEETVRQLASLVDSKVNQALGINKNVSFQNALLLAALHLAEESTLLKLAASTRLKSLEQKTLDILTDLEDSPISRIRIDS
jgi:cell division protein ZapA